MLLRLTAILQTESTSHELSGHIKAAAVLGCSCHDEYYAAFTSAAALMCPTGSWLGIFFAELDTSCKDVDELHADMHTLLKLSMIQRTLFDSNFIVLTEFLGAQGVSDPEKKRKVIGAAFIDVFNNFARGLEEKGGVKPTFLVQGTLYPDVIESCPPPGSKQKHSHTIKSHHNVGGLPKDLQFKLIEPLRELFKVAS